MRIAHGLKWKGMYPTATAHRAQNRGFISFKITQQVVQTFSNSKPRDKATISLKVLNPKGIWNCCYSKACEGHEGSFYLAELLPAQFFWFLFASWTIYLEETQTRTATFRRLELTHVHSQISLKLFLEWRISPQLFLYKQPNSQSQKSWTAEWGQECNRLATTSNSLVLSTVSATNFLLPKSSYRK